MTAPGSPPLAVGDRVRVRSRLSGFTRATGTVVRTSGAAYVVAFDAAELAARCDHVPFWRGELELVERGAGDGDDD